MAAKKLILRCNLSPGDIVMLTAAVRDLHGLYPGRFVTDVRTRCAPIWEHNPWITTIEDSDPEAEVIDCDYPLINDSNRAPYHCLHGFAQFLSERLGLDIRPTQFRGDIHLAPIEKRWMSQVHELTGEDTPFWIIVAGGKFDVTIKWWSAERFQRVVDHFHGRLQFVQVGQRGHYHPRLDNVIDLRGRTDLRQYIRLMHHAHGVVCPVTCAMHLAAAIETKPGAPAMRPCVVIAGAREPAHWEAYPGHQFLQNVGAMHCSRGGGCWKARTRPLNDGDERDRNLCIDVVNELPRCMDMITADHVIEAIEGYLRGGVSKQLTQHEFAAAQKAVAAANTDNNSRLTVFTARHHSEEFIRTIDAPPSVEGRGIVIPAGGPKYLPCAWVCIDRLRKHGCGLPIQLWHLGPEEVDDRFRKLVEKFDVKFIDAHVVRTRHPARTLNGWELKCYAILHSGFREVLLLDADNVPLRDPECLFHTPEYDKTGAIFWPDYGRLSKERAIWALCGVRFRDEPEFETGQIVVDRERCHKALRLAMFYNENSDFYYRHIHGDKDTFHLAFRKIGTEYAMPSKPIESLGGVMCQHDFDGRRIFQHRNSHKWSLHESNRRIPGFLQEEECLASLEQLRAEWNPAPVHRVSGVPA
jgi:ADP-heptose:LPS heptosyltransferase